MFEEDREKIRRDDGKALHPQYVVILVRDLCHADGLGSDLVRQSRLFDASLEKG